MDVLDDPDGGVFGQMFRSKTAADPDADELFYAELAAGENGFKQICAGLMWTSDFVTAAGELWSCPCYYIAHEAFVFKGAPLDKIATVVNIDQEPFYRVSFGVRPGVAYRGGYALHSANIHITGDTDPMIGNIFAFGQTTARGGPPEARQDTGGIQSMSVEIVPEAGASPKAGTMYVYGLAFDPHIDARTLIIYYGDGGADDKTKQLYVSAPGSRRTRLDATKLTGGTGLKNDVWVTSIRVTSPNTIVAVAKTVITDDADGSHLFMSVIAPRAQGLFDGAGEIGARVALANVKGNVYAPKYTVTQYLAAPVVCSDFRSDCIEPLDQTSPFLPPEMRDFHLTLRDMDWRHVPDLNVTVSRLIFSEFNGGNQQVAAIPSLLSVPEFRVTESSVEGTTFDFQTYTPMGPPAFWAFFARVGQPKRVGSAHDYEPEYRVHQHRQEVGHHPGHGHCRALLHNPAERAQPERLRRGRLQGAPGDPDAVGGRRHDGHQPGTLPAREARALPGPGLAPVNDQRAHDCLRRDGVQQPGVADCGKGDLRAISVSP